MTEQQKPALTQEFNGLNLTRFIQEAVSEHSKQNIYMQIFQLASTKKKNNDRNNYVYISIIH